MTLYLEAATTIPDLFIDYIEVRLASGEMRTPPGEITSTGEIEQSFRLN